MSRRSDLWLSVKTHKQPNEFINQLRKEGYKFFITDLSPGAIPLSKLRFNNNNNDNNSGKGGKDEEGCYWVEENEKIALVLGCEMNGVSPFMKENAGIH